MIRIIFGIICIFVGCFFVYYSWKEIIKRMKLKKEKELFKFFLHFPDFRSRMQILFTGEILLQQKEANELYYYLQKTLKKDLVPQFTNDGFMVMMPKDFLYQMQIKQRMNRHGQYS